MSRTLVPLSLSARFTRVTTHERWCFAVSFGRKPSPGGETKVWRMLERISAGLPGVCLISPTPSLLAEPSRPRAIIVQCLGRGRNKERNKREGGEEEEKKRRGKEGRIREGDQ